MKKNLLVVCMCSIAIGVLFHFQMSDAKTTQVNSKKVVKVEKQKKYTLQSFLKQTKSGKLYGGYKADKILKKVKKAKKVKLSGKGITVRKMSFMIKKEGDYTLNIRVDNKKYSIYVKAVPKTFTLDALKISRVTISAMINDPTLKTIEITDQQTLVEIAKSMNEARYQFDFRESSKKLVGCLKYYVSVYDTDNRLIHNLRVAGKYTWSDTDNTAWGQTSGRAENAYQYLDQLFQQLYK